jgi:S1-C subfamily serine protease
MKAWLVPVGMIFLGACVSPSTTLVNDQGVIVHCSATGFGIVSGTMANNRFEECVSTAQMNGFVEAPHAGVIGVTLEDGEGVVVTAVLAGSPAQLAGIERGDLILSVNGKNVDTAAKARSLLFGTPGTQVTLLMHRGGVQLLKVVTRVPFQQLVKNP